MSRFKNRKHFKVSDDEEYFSDRNTQPNQKSQELYASKRKEPSSIPSPAPQTNQHSKHAHHHHHHQNSQNPKQNNTKKYLLSQIPESKEGDNMSSSSNTSFSKDFNLQDYISQLMNKRKSIKYDSLTQTHVWAYSVGHFLNDLTAACWFNYLLFWFKEVLNFEQASWAMLSGQFFDAITTPLVGYLSDNTNTKFGKRKPWYVGGTILVILGFFPVFHSKVPISIWPELGVPGGMRSFYYIFFPSLFNVGWAAVQISHMSLVPSLTVSRTKRDLLNNRRNTFSFIANLCVLAFALILFQLISDSILDFELLACIVLALGSVTSAFFIWKIQEVPLTKSCQFHVKRIQAILDVKKSKSISSSTSNHHNINGEDEEVEEMEDSQAAVVEAHSSDDSVASTNQLIKGKSWREWMKEWQFYHYGLVYMGCRLYCNVISTMLNFYMVYVLKIQGSSSVSSTPMEIALIPLLLFVSSVIVSSVLDMLYASIGKKKTFSIGGILMCLSSLMLSFVEPESSFMMFPIAILVGCTQVLLLNTAITLISDVIGLQGDSGAFVFGAYSFMDKISTGIALFFISESSLFETDTFIRLVTVLLPLVSGIFAWVLVIVGNLQEINDTSTMIHTPENSYFEDCSSNSCDSKGKKGSDQDEENEDGIHQRSQTLDKLLEKIQSEFAS